MGTAAMAAWIAQGRKATWSILAGAALVNVYLVWLYARASQRGRDAGSDSWANK
jgi:hypothetical protein